MATSRILSSGKYSFFLMLLVVIVMLLAFSAFSHAVTNEKDPLDQSVREFGITPEFIRVHHQALVDIATNAGGLDSGIRLNEAGREAVEFLFRGYQEAGLNNVRFEEFYPNRWWPEQYDLAVIGGSGRPDQKLKAFPLWSCEGANNLELEVVYVGYGTSGEFRGLDVKGKAVLVDMKRILHFIPSFNLTKALDTAKEKGAKAVIVAEAIVDAPTGDPVGKVGDIKEQKGTEPRLYPVPAFSISKSDGQILKKRVDAGPTKVRMNLKYSLSPGTARNLVGELPGNGKTNEVIIIGGHYDSWFDGAIDNLGSQASLLAIAKYFSRIPQAQRNRTLLFVSLFGHEYGVNTEMGHAAFVEKRSDLQGRVTCFLNIDGSGSWGWEEKDDTGEILPTNADDKGGVFTTSWALSAISHRAVYKYAKGPWGQYPLNSFVADLYGPISGAGWPCLLLISKHIYYHSPLDTIDRITPDQVYRRTLLNISVINELLESPAGYLIRADTNPNRKSKEGDSAKADLTPDKLPQNPYPWTKGAPTDLSMNIVPLKPHVFSPVITWVSYFKADAVETAENIRWGFGNLLGLVKPPKPHLVSGSMYFLPGTKKISMTVTDSKGRSSSITREITVTAGPYAVVYWIAYALVGLICLWVLRVIWRRVQR